MIHCLIYVAILHKEKWILLNPCFKNGPFPAALFQNSESKGPFRHEYIFYCFSSKLFFVEYLWCVEKNSFRQTNVTIWEIFSFPSTCKRVTSGSDSLLNSKFTLLNSKFCGKDCRVRVTLWTRPQVVFCGYTSSVGGFVCLEINH